MKAVLSIAGSDPTGGAGIQGDLKTFVAHRVYGMAVLTAVIAQNSLRVSVFEPVGTKLLEAQLEAVFTDIKPDAVKIGLLPDTGSIRAVQSTLERFQPSQVVFDPVLSSSNGRRFLPHSDIHTLFDLFALTRLITPNVPEASELSGIQIAVASDIEKAAAILRKRSGGTPAVLIKGGHFGAACDDFLLAIDGGRWIKGERLLCHGARGTGCALSSAIASNLALGYPLETAIIRSKQWLTAALKNAPSLGKGVPPLLHSANSC